MKIISLETLLTDELKDIYRAENLMIKALPKMAKAAASTDLRKTFENHLIQTQTQAQRLKEIFNDLKLKPKGKNCIGMEGIIDEGKQIIQSDPEEEPLDAALIGIAQRLEHYEIACYGTARAHARQLGFLRIAEVLSKTLEEEKQTDRHLTFLAENRVNVIASMSKTGVRSKDRIDITSVE
jgi:ferritin-like metal-binding protein YciE